MSEEHQCEAMTRAYHSGYGEAIKEIHKADGENAWWAGSENGEYGTQIFYCPFCGLRLP